MSDKVVFEIMLERTKAEFITCLSEVGVEQKKDEASLLLLQEAESRAQICFAAIMMTFEGFTKDYQDLVSATNKVRAEYDLNAIDLVDEKSGDEYVKAEDWRTYVKYTLAVFRDFQSIFDDMMRTVGRYRDDYKDYSKAKDRFLNGGYSSKKFEMHRLLHKKKIIEKIIENGEGNNLAVLEKVLKLTEYKNDDAVDEDKINKSKKELSDFFKENASDIPAYVTEYVETWVKE